MVAATALMRSGEPMSDDELAAYVKIRAERALNRGDGALSEQRQDALDYYMAEPYGDEEDGRSSYVTQEVAEAVEWAMPSLIRVFMSGERVVKFDAVGPEDEPAAEQETDTVNHVLLHQQEGFMEMYSWIKDALLYPNAYIKAWVEYETMVRRETYHGLTRAGMHLLINNNPGLQVESWEEVPSETMTPFGPALEVLYNIDVRYTLDEPRLNIMSLPPEEVLVGENCTRLNLDTSDFVVHRTKKMRTDLLEMGVPEEILNSVAATSTIDYHSERTNRMKTEDESPIRRGIEHRSLQEYEVMEGRVKIDYDGDGIAEYRYVFMVGNHVVWNEEDDYQAICALGAIPQTHRHVARSLAHMMMPLQRVLSVLHRQLLDNLYRINVPREKVGRDALLDDESTMDALLDAAAQVIPCKDPSAIQPHTIDSVIDQVLPVIQHMDDARAMRSGVNPGQSLDPNVLKESTLGAFLGAMNKASERLELMARVMAETGFRQLMAKVHRLNRQYLGKPTAYKIRGQWTEVNPAEWRERVNLTIDTGVGFGTREQEVALLMGILDLQKQGLETGLSTPERIFNTVSELVVATGRKNPDKYFQNPQLAPPKPPSPTEVLTIESLKAQVQMMQAQIVAMQQQQLLETREQTRKEVETGAKIEKMQGDVEVKLTELELEHDTNVPGATV